MSSGAERLTKERKNTVRTYIKNKIHTIRVYRKFTDKNYFRWVKMIDLQKRLCHRNLCHVATNKIKSFCSKKHPTKAQVKIYKRKANESDEDDDKSVYICEDLAYRIIRYTNLGVIEADEFRKNFGIKKDQSI